MLKPTTRLLVLIMVAVFAFAGTARAQWISIYSDEPHNLGYDHLTELSDLLELDASMHELLIELHLEMIRAENAKRQEVREIIDKRNAEGDQVGWRDSMRLAMDMTDDFEAIADRFFADVRLMVLPEQIPLVDHIRARAEMAGLYDDIGSEVSGLGAHPFELLREEQVVSPVRFRELVLELSRQERLTHELFGRAFDTVMEMQRIGQEFGFDADDAGPEQLAELAKIFKDALETVQRLRDANETLADQIIERLDDEQREKFESAWLERNYDDVQELSPAERAVREVMQDEEAGEELRTRINELRPNFERRMATARKMARIAKRKTDLDIDFRRLMESGERNTEIYDDALERMLGVAESYEAALKGVMTPEQRVRYGLDRPERPIGEPELLR